MKTVLICQWMLVSVFGVCLSFSVAADEDHPDEEWVLSTNRLPTNSSGQVDLRQMPFVGNGHIATVIKSDYIHMSGFFSANRSAGYLARIPNYLNIEVRQQNVTERKYSLDMCRGAFVEEIRSEGILITQRTFASQTIPQVLVVQLEFQSAGGKSVSIDLTQGSTALTSDLAYINSTSNSNNSTYVFRFQQTTTEQTPRNVYVYVSYLPKQMKVKNETIVLIMSIDANQTEAEMAFRSASASAMDLWTSHAARWIGSIWREGYTEAQDNLDLTRTMFTSMYAIMSSVPAPSSGKRFKGLSGGSPVRGGIGDSSRDAAEMWTLPPVLILNPQYANQILNYRLSTRLSAAAFANRTGFRGYRFESDVAGNDIHINGGIAFAVRQYLSATGDAEWMRKDGCDLVAGIADFWRSRVSYSPEKGAFVINNVRCFDQYPRDVNNSAYTNIVASYALKFASYAACLCGKQPSVDWNTVAEKLFLPLNSALKSHDEYEGYAGATIQQSSVVMLGFPLMFTMPVDLRRADLRRYDRVTDKMAPPTSWALKAIGYMELNDYQTADGLFNRSYQQYIRGPFKVWTESPNGDGISHYINGAGAFLQAIIFGYAGVRLHYDRLEVDPQLPPGCSNLMVHGMDYIGFTISLKIFEYEIQLVMLSVPSVDDELTILSASGSSFSLGSGDEMSLPPQKLIIQQKAKWACPILTDSTGFAETVYAQEFPASTKSATDSLPATAIYSQSAKKSSSSPSAMTRPINVYFLIFLLMHSAILTFPSGCLVHIEADL